MEWTVTDVASVASAVVAVLGAWSARQSRVDTEITAAKAEKLQERAVEAHKLASAAQQKIARQAGIDSARAAKQLHVEFNGDTTLIIINPGPKTIDHLEITCDYISNRRTFERYVEPLEPVRIELTPPKHRGIGTHKYDRVEFEWKDGNYSKRQVFMFNHDD